MKIAITAQGTDMQAPVDRRFGRAGNFIVVDVESGQFTAADNSQNLNSAQGAGIQAARQVAELGVQAVITGHVGPKAFATLQAAGIEIYAGAEGSVAEALEAFKAGQLTQATNPDVEGHWV